MNIKMVAFNTILTNILMELLAYLKDMSQLMRGPKPYLNMHHKLSISFKHMSSVLNTQTSLKHLPSYILITSKFFERSTNLDKINLLKIY